MFSQLINPIRSFPLVKSNMTPLSEDRNGMPRIDLPPFAAALMEAYWSSIGDCKEIGHLTFDPANCRWTGSVGQGGVCKR